MNSLFALKKLQPLFMNIIVLLSLLSLHGADNWDNFKNTLQNLDAELDNTQKTLGHVIIFCGGTCTGKSKIVDAFWNLSKDKNQDYITVGIDTFSDDNVERAEMSSPLCGRKIGWCGEHALSYVRIKELVEQGKDVLCDTVLVTNDGREITESFLKKIRALRCHVYCIFVQCPLEMILKNFEKRKDKRDLFSVLSQFTSLYKRAPQKKAENNRQIFELTLSEIKTACAKIMSQTDLKTSQKEYAVRDLMKRFGVNNNSKEESIDICPNSNVYDYIFKNDQQEISTDKLLDLFTWVQQQLNPRDIKTQNDSTAQLNDDIANQYDDDFNDEKK